MCRSDRKHLNKGEVVWLQAQQRPFLAIHTESVDIDTRGAAIILHDRAAYPDQQVVVHALRTILPEHRWSTLALQMPIREMGASAQDYYPLFPEAKARIEAAVDFLDKTEVGNIVVVGYGMGALMGLYSIDKNLDNTLGGLVTISLPVSEGTDRRPQFLARLAKIRLPLLDIYAEHDLPAVVNGARKRQLAANKNPAYRQDEISATDHLYRHNEALLVKRVYSWLSRLMQQQDGG
nr:DUF3530 family protein [Methylomarinum sp. Ch1-1]MDP4519568.1 DUF3530 family protein [Methylomarinum sp. Ch1-1]